MNTDQINKILNRSPTTHNTYIGCFASDQIPATGMHRNFPYCMVVNVDPASLGGSHWIALFLNSANNLEYYDSTGVWPPPSSHIRQFLLSDGFSRVRINRLPLQAENARTCGKHVIFFIHHRCLGIPFTKIVEFLCNGKRSPDAIVNEFVGKMYK